MIITAFTFELSFSLNLKRIVFSTGQQRYASTLPRLGFLFFLFSFFFLSFFPLKLTHCCNVTTAELFQLFCFSKKKQIDFFFSSIFLPIWLKITLFFSIILKSFNKYCVIFTCLRCNTYNTYVFKVIALHWIKKTWNET